MRSLQTSLAAALRRQVDTTAKEAFAKAVEWHVVEKFTNVSISNGRKRYSIAEFSSVMALIEIANTLDREC